MKIWISTLSLTPVNVHGFFFMGTLTNPKSLLRWNNISKNNTLMDKLDSFYSGLNLQMCSSVYDAPEALGRAKITVDIAIYLHQTHTALVRSKYVLRKHLQGATETKSFSDAGNNLYAKPFSTFISSCLQIFRMQVFHFSVFQDARYCLVLILVLSHKHFQYNVDTDIFSLLSNSRKQL